MDSIIRLFIASSFDTAHERAVVGDAVRKLNDVYEPRGWRIRLHCWEDYEPEYRGIRKQTEYNEDLIKTSDIFIALFRGNCGKFTQEEIGVWKDELKRVPVVFDIFDTSVDKSVVQSYLTGQSLTPIAIASDDDIYTQVERLVLQSMTAPPATTSAASIDAKEIYVTIPEDRSSERAPLGNLVRSVDDMAERTFHIRCRLTTGVVAKIPDSDYYVAILKDRVSVDEENEILTAIQCCNATQKPIVELYYNHDDKVCGNYPEINNAINGRGIFNEPFDSFHRIKFNLVRWLHQQSILRVELNAGIDIKDGWFVFFRMPVVPLSVLGINGGTLAQQLAELFKLFSFAVLGVNTQITTSTGEVDLDALDAQMSSTNILGDAIQGVEKEIIARREKWLQQVSKNIGALLAGEINVGNIGRLTNLIDRKEKLQAVLSAAPKELLRTQMLMVQVSDTYPQLFDTTGRDADAQYLKIAQTADGYNIKDPTVEMMRMNYANYLHRQNRNEEALAFYETAMANINTFEGHSELMRRYIMHLYVTYINFVVSLRENQRAIDAIKSLIEKENAWERQGLTEAEAITNQCQILACQLRIRPLMGNVLGLLNHAIDIYRKVCSIPIEVFDPTVRTDVYCDLPNNIAATAIDAQPYLRMPEDELEHNIGVLLGQVVKCTEQNLNDSSSLVYRSNAFHNWAFFYSQIKGDQDKSRELCEKALTIRRQIYALSKEPDSLYEVAESLLMLGATYVNDIEGQLSENHFQTALHYAEECLSIYQTLNKEHFLEQDLRVYEAMQLKGSVLYYGGRKDDGLALLKEVWTWNEAHPTNHYAPVFRGVAGEILKREGII